jgi:hypothetical protein
METRRDEAANEHVQNIRAGIPVMNSLYGVTIDEYDYIDMSIDALRDIKHFGITEYIAYVPVNMEGYASLPCNTTIIDAVTTSKMGRKVFRDRILSTLEVSTENDDYYLQKEVMNSIGFGVGYFIKPGLADVYGDGYISYFLTDDKKIKVDPVHGGSNIGIAYKGISVDPEGYPLITRKQANALAAIVAKNVLTRKAYKGDKVAIAMLELAMNNSARLKQAASIPERITDNELDEMLNAQTTFNRKTYGRPSKYSR